MWWLINGWRRKNHKTGIRLAHQTKVMATWLLLFCEYMTGESILTPMILSNLKIKKNFHIY